MNDHKLHIDPLEELLRLYSLQEAEPVVSSLFSAEQVAFDTPAVHVPDQQKINRLMKELANAEVISSNIQHLIILKWLKNKLFPYLFGTIFIIQSILLIRI